MGRRERLRERRPGETLQAAATAAPLQCLVCGHGPVRDAVRAAEHALIVVLAAR